MTNVPDWRKFFPLKNVRPQQAQALDSLVSDVIAGKRVHLAELGTGVGKSAVAVTFAAWLDAYEQPSEGFVRGAVVLTSQKLLQDQYVRDFSEARDLRSSTNFQCAHADLGPTCAITARVRKAFKVVQGDDQHDNRLACKACPYRMAKESFINGRLGVTNYSYFLSEAVYANELPLRHLLVLDEAHNVEDEVRKWATVDVTEKEAHALDIDFLNHGDSTDGMLKWLSEDYRHALIDRMGEIATKLSKVVLGGQLGEKVLGKLAEDNEELDKRLCQVNRVLNKGGRIMTSFDQEKGYASYQPLDVSEMTNEILYSRGNRVLLMTATVLDRDVFQRSAGLPPGSAFVSVPTPFAAKSFGVKFRPIGKLSRVGIEKSLMRLPRAIKKILADHQNDKGIIHTTNYEVTKKLMELKNPRLLIQESAVDRDAIIKQHVEGKAPTVLVSPGMTEGLDLRDDLARFQVICKVPYPSMSDPVVKEKMNLDREWYAWRTVRSLTQAMGRSVRSQSDYTTTYILDECYMDMLDKWMHMFPKHLTSEMEIEEPF